MLDEAWRELEDGGTVLVSMWLELITGDDQELGEPTGADEEATDVEI